MAEERRARRHWLRWSLVIPPAAVLCAAAATLVSDPDDGLRTLLELQEQARDARGRVEALEREKLRLGTLVRELQEEPDQIEAAARTRLGMVRTGEIVVRMPAPGHR